MECINHHNIKKKLMPRIQACIGIGLALWVFVLSTASVTPTLHGWICAQPQLHSSDTHSPTCEHDEDSEHSHSEPSSTPSAHQDHFCAVKFFKHGFHSEVSLIALDTQTEVGANLIPANFTAVDKAALGLPQPRAPPLSIFVDTALLHRFGF